MTSVVPLVERKTAFDPEEVAILVAAFEEAWARLRASGSECTRPAYARAMREVVARRIFDVARRGMKDAEQIATEAASFLEANYRHESRRQAS
jgi:hypothetical protein